MIAVLKDRFEDKSYDYNKIFFTGDDVLPRWAGYRLGYLFCETIFTSEWPKYCTGNTG